MRSDHDDDVMRTLGVSRHGVSYYSNYMAVGGGAALTGSHQETKGIPAMNIGSGDFIQQPLTTEANLWAYEQLLDEVFVEVGGYSRSN